VSGPCDVAPSCGAAALVGNRRMDASAGNGRRGALSDYLAAERTLLAWIRTGLALMGFGFVVARFGLFLQQLQVTELAPTAQSSGLSLWFGTALIAVGVVVSVLSGWRHARLVGELDRGDSDPGGVLSVRRFADCEGAERLDESRAHRRTVSRWRRSQPRRWPHSRRTADGTMTRAADVGSGSNSRVRRSEPRIRRGPFLSEHAEGAVRANADVAGDP